uniref:Uncharacterized protein LOC111116540 n=1 Tax=Crassostrea virginica TaxID=6565 RepID=A0A8B8C6A8_CRAVI|nr:uncharacterized protein LOC111116540 [Crassostrea virginica]
MWSSLRNDNKIDHFVPLIPIEKRQDTILEDFFETSMSFDEHDNSFINQFLESVLESDSEIPSESERYVTIPEVNQPSAERNGSILDIQTPVHVADTETEVTMPEVNQPSAESSDISLNSENHEFEQSEETVNSSRTSIEFTEWPQLETPVKMYNTGEYLLLKCGTKFFPAVVSIKLFPFY